MKEFRPAIIRMHENGYSVREIAEILSVPKSIVHGDIKRFEETDLNANRVGRGKTSKAKTEENIRKVARLIQKDPSSKVNLYVNSLRKLAKKSEFLVDLLRSTSW
jgi:transposase